MTIKNPGKLWLAMLVPALVAGLVPKYGLRIAGPITPVLQAAARHELVDFLSREPSLEETFLAEYGRQATEVSSR